MSGAVDVLAMARADLREFRAHLRDTNSLGLAIDRLLERDAAVAELIEAATELRARQRDYLSQPKGERTDEKGRMVGEAASRVDAALARVGGAK